MMLSSMCRRFTRWTRAKNISHINRNSNPQSHQQQRDIRIYRPGVSYYPGEIQICKPREFYYPDDNDIYDNKKVALSKAEPRNDLVYEYMKERSRANKKLVLSKAERLDPTISLVASVHYLPDDAHDSYIDAAFRSTRTNEVYLLFQDEYLVLNYTPGTTNARVVDGPRDIVQDAFHPFYYTEFFDHGISAAFGCHGGHDESFIFSRNKCAKINYAHGITNAKILEGPELIVKMFPFFKGTKFSSMVDAAFESSVPNQVYIFKGREYALVDYIQRKLIHIRPIVDGFNCLQNTIFDSDIGAAFASHNSQEAYLFKGNSYVILHFTPGQTKDYIISGPKEIVPNNWPSLVNILPRFTYGFPMPEYT